MRLRILWVAAALLSASLVARADTLTEGFTVSGSSVENDAGVYGIASTPIDLFNPSLGTLTSITIDLSGDVIALGSMDDFDSFSDVVAASDVHQELVFGSGFGFGGATFAISADGSNSLPFDLSLLEGTGTTDLDLAFIGPTTIAADDGVTGTLTYNYTPPSTTPEPSSFLLLGTGLMGFAGLGWRRLAWRRAG